MNFIIKYYGILNSWQLHSFLKNITVSYVLEYCVQFQATEYKNYMNKVKQMTTVVRTFRVRKS